VFKSLLRWPVLQFLQKNAFANGCTNHISIWVTPKENTGSLESTPSNSASTRVDAGWPNGKHSLFALHVTGDARHTACACRVHKYLRWIHGNHKQAVRTASRRMAHGTRSIDPCRANNDGAAGGRQRLFALLATLDTRRVLAVYTSTYDGSTAITNKPCAQRPDEWRTARGALSHAVLITMGLPAHGSDCLPCM